MGKLFFSREIKILFALTCALDLGMLVFGFHESLDQRFFYTGLEARFLLDSLSVEETRRYFLNELFDLVLIGLYSRLFFLSLKRRFPQRPGLRFIAFVPGFFDLLETTAVLYALTAEGPHSFFDLLGLVTFLKWLTGAAVLSLIFLTAWLA